MLELTTLTAMEYTTSLKHEIEKKVYICPNQLIKSHNVRIDDDGQEIILRGHL